MESLAVCLQTMGGIVFRKQSTYICKSWTRIFRLFGTRGDKTRDYNFGIGEGLGVIRVKGKVERVKLKVRVRICRVCLALFS